MKRGPKPKLTRDDCDDIRRMYADRDRDVKTRSLSHIFRVSQATILKVLNEEYIPIEDYMDQLKQQEREYRRQEAIQKAVQAADRIIMDASDGSCEETDYLTAKVMEAFAAKVLGRIQSVLLSRDLNLNYKK